MIGPDQGPVARGGRTVLLSACGPHGSDGVYTRCSFTLLPAFCHKKYRAADGNLLRRETRSRPHLVHLHLVQPSDVWDPLPVRHPHPEFPRI